jgi:hypothetical protein
MAGSGYAYNPDWSTNQFITHNVGNDIKSPTAAWSYATPSGNAALAVRAINGRSAALHQRGEDRKIQETYTNDQRILQARNPSDYFNAVDPTGAAAQYADQRARTGQGFASAQELQAAQDQGEIQNYRKGLTNNINSYFADPGRQAEYQHLIGNQLNADTQQIGHQFDVAGTQAGLNAARQGLMGGSHDAETQAQLTGQRQSALVGAAQNANQTQSNLTARDRQMQDQLLNLVNSDDPYMRQAATAQLQGLQQMSATDAYQNASQQARIDSNQFAQNQMSQSIGGGLQGIAGLINQDPNRGNLSGWYGSPARN